MSNEADIIANAGDTITLTGGQTMKIRYGMSSFRAIEKEYGSVAAFGAEVEKKEQGSMFSLISFGLWAGTAMKLPLSEFEDKLELANFKDYALVFGAQFQLALESLNPGEAPAATAA